ncbi:ligase-associated DNA damage response endonuclease PdeM [Alphaproteobacteria bacterium]|jgi:DNA ligase-associated metallophosphoesterase|nr:ligase-associated DNA damage response endonuclease PdeM [Alphaproteobacteria bacterium]NCF48644.1 ligase-associated DNA damage response endonuclease PdeM [Bacteroidota bacterium]
MSNLSIDFAGHRFDLHPSGAMFWQAEASLIVGDLHLEKASSYHASGQFLPPYDTVQTLDRLAGTVTEFAPRQLILLGDIFHDGAAWGRMQAADQARLTDILAPLSPIWIEGNHDQHFVPPGHFGSGQHDRAGIVLRHIMDKGEASPEISAHFHPAAVISHRGTRLRRPCFVKTRTKLVLPAFGALTGGLDCSDSALSLLHGQDTQLYLLGTDGVFAAPKGCPPQTRSRRGY